MRDSQEIGEEGVAALRIIHEKAVADVFHDLQPR
jgi:hypothetical protein